MLIPFEFDGVKSSVYGLYVCSFDGGTSEVRPLGNDMTKNTVKAPSGKRWLQTGNIYEAPLSFTFQIAKYECGKGVTAIEPRELAQMLRWLVRRENHYLRFEQHGWDNVFYNCTLKAQKYEIGGTILGLEIEAVCDAPWGYSEPKEYSFSLNEISDFKIYNYSDEDGGLLPDFMQIEILRPCDIRITNTFLIKNDETRRKETKTEIKNCQAGEILQMDWHRNIKSSNPERNIMDDFNHIFLELFSDLSNSRNTITVKDISSAKDTNTEPENNLCNIFISYREIRKGVPV